MTEKDFDQFAVLISATGELYGKPQTKMAISLWWNALKHLDLPAVKEALNRHIRQPDTGQFMPRPADIIRMLGGTTTDSAMLAWSKVDEAVRKVGIYRDIAFDDPIIHRVIYDMGGWTIFGTKSEDEWPFVAKEFQTRYRGYATTGGVIQYPKILTGLANAHNRSQGFEVQPVTFFGDPVRVKQVIESAIEVSAQIQQVSNNLLQSLEVA